MGQWQMVRLGKLVEAVELPTFIWEVPNSNVSRSFICPEFFFGFPQSLQENAGIVS
jgi:hypothetical protein